MSTLQTKLVRKRPSGWSSIILFGMVLLAVISGAILLLSDLFPSLSIYLTHAPVSALPLLLIGTTYAMAQLLLRPQRWDLLQALLVSTAFVCWGIYQLLPASPGATFLGDLVITMYVVDLSIGIGKQLQRRSSATCTDMEQAGG